MILSFESGPGYARVDPEWIGVEASPPPPKN